MSKPAMIKEVTDGVAIWRLNQPELRNPLSAELKAEFTQAAAEFRDTPDQRALIITGTDDIFCAGGDLRSMDKTPGTVGTRGRLAETHAFMQVLTSVEKPGIMAVNGSAPERLWQCRATSSSPLTGPISPLAFQGWMYCVTWRCFTPCQGSSGWPAPRISS